MHVSYESGVLEDPLHAPNEDMFQLTKNPSEWPNEPDELKITFSEGIPVLVENTKTNERIENSLSIMKYLNAIGGRHGVGRIDVSLLLVQFLHFLHTQKFL